MTKNTPITVLLPADAESWTAFLRRMKGTPGDLLAILSGRDEELEEQEELRVQFLSECAQLRDRLRIATKQPHVVAEARKRGMRVLDRTKYLRLLLRDHEKLPEALRVFSPHLWRQQLKSRLQRLGLLSIPRIRIYALVGLSVVLFLFVVLRLLPSADVRIKPREEAVSQPMNLLLVQSGAVVDLATRIRTMPLFPITVTLRQSLTSNYISKDFIGSSAHVPMTIINGTDQPYSLRSSTRLTNQAGMIFRLQEPVVQLQPGKEVTVMAKASDLDLYDQIIGERGNVPAGLKWQIPGLSPEEQQKIYGENRKPGVGGTTAYRSVLRKADLDLALHQLEQQLLVTARERSEEEKNARNARDRDRLLAILNYPTLTKAVTSGAVLPTADLGKTVSSFTVAESLSYTVLAYDQKAILSLLSHELLTHVRADKQLVQESLSLENLDVRVVSYDDNLSWVKLTVELVGRDRYVLDPFTPTGALFGKSVRDKIAGLPKADALRIVKNMPEVEEAEIAIWPPWQSSLPTIPSNISISLP